MARFVLITGLTGSGKSKISELLRNKHYIVINCDEHVKNYYMHPIVHQQLTEKFGPSVLERNGEISKKFITNLFLKNNENKNFIAEVILPKMLWELKDKYNSSKEVIFIEGALTREIGYVCSYLNIKKVIKVDASSEKRISRIKKRQNYKIHLKLSVLQDEKNLYKINIGDECCGENLDLEVFNLINDCSEDELNGRLMNILQNNLEISHNEKMAVFSRYLKECPTYCHDNIWCYSFYNCGGCNSCPFPCANQDRFFKRGKENNE